MNSNMTTRVKLEQLCSPWVTVMSQDKQVTHSLSRVVVPATLYNISVNAHFTRFL